MADIDCEGNMHHELCKILVENIPFNQCSDHSLIATFLEGCGGELKCAIDKVAAFCNAHSFLISLYDAIIPMEANVKVDRRAVIWKRYQHTVCNLMLHFEWDNASHENNVLSQLQKMMDGDHDIKHLCLNARVLASPAQKVNSFSHTEAINYMTKIMTKCYEEVLSDQHSIYIYIKLFPAPPPHCLPVTDLIYFLGDACKAISAAVTKHLQAIKK